MEGNYAFSSPEWDDISENAKDLVRKESSLILVALKRRIAESLIKKMKIYGNICAEFNFFIKYFEFILQKN